MKDFNVVGEKMTKNGRKMANSFFAHNKYKSQKEKITTKWKLRLLCKFAQNHLHEKNRVKKLHELCAQNYTRKCQKQSYN